MSALTVSRADLRRACKLASVACKGKSILPHAESLLLQAYGDGSLILRATDLEMHVAVRVSEESGAAFGPCAVAFKMFSDIVDKSAGNSVEIECGDKMLTLKSEGSKAKIAYVAADTYPLEPAAESAVEGVTLSVESLSAIIGQIGHAAEKMSMGRPITECVSIVPDGEGGAYALAIDGYRMERRAIPDEGEISAPLSVNAACFSTAIGALASAGESAARMITSKSWCSLVTENATIHMRLLDEAPVNDRKIIPEQSPLDTIATVDRDALLLAAQRAALYAVGEHQPIHVRLEDDAIVIQAASELGEVSSRVGARYRQRGTLRVLGVNPRYLIDCLSKGWKDAGLLEIRMRSEISPILVTAGGREETDLSMILPARILNGGAA